MEGKGEDMRNQDGKLVAEGKSETEERVLVSSSNYKTCPDPRRESSSELPAIAVLLVLTKVSLATGKRGHSQMPRLVGYSCRTATDKSSTPQFPPSVKWY